MYGLETMVWRAWWWVEERIGSVVWTLFFYRQLTDDACGVWRTWKPTLASFSIRLRARRWTAFSTPSKLGEPFFNAHMASIDVTTTDEPNAAKQQMFNRAGGRSFSAHNSRRLVGWKLLTFDLFECFRRPFGAYLVVVVMVRRPTGRLMVYDLIRQRKDGFLCCKKNVHIHSRSAQLRAPAKVKGGYVLEQVFSLPI